MLLNDELHRRIGSVPFLGMALGGPEGDHAAVEACPHPLRLVYQFNNRFARIGCPECNVVCVVPQEGAQNAWREPLGDDRDRALLARVLELQERTPEAP
jgi:hypothetical protein